jgi:hypothetical protein
MVFTGLSGFTAASLLVLVPGITTAGMDAAGTATAVAMQDAGDMDIVAATQGEHRMLAAHTAVVAMRVRLAALAAATPVEANI